MKGNDVFFDTNVLVYAFAKNDPRSLIAEDLLAKGGAIGVQALNEFVAVASRKLAMPWPDIQSALSAIRDLCSEPVPITLRTHVTALQIAEVYGFHIYDSLVIAAALEAQSTILLTEDMNDGQIVQGLTIRNPFRPKRSN